MDRTVMAELSFPAAFGDVAQEQSRARTEYARERHSAGVRNAPVPTEELFTHAGAKAEDN
jgi:hypothetical protein